MRLTTQRFIIVTRPDVRCEIFKEHRAVGSVVAPVVHFAAARKNHGEKNR